MMAPVISSAVVKDNACAQTSGENVGRMKPDNFLDCSRGKVRAAPGVSSLSQTHPPVVCSLNGNPAGTNL